MLLPDKLYVFYLIIQIKVFTKQNFLRYDGGEIFVLGPKCNMMLMDQGGIWLNLIRLVFGTLKLKPYHHPIKTGIFARRARVDQAVGLYYRKET